MADALDRRRQGDTLVADQKERDSIQIREMSPSGIRWFFERVSREAPAPKNRPQHANHATRAEFGSDQEFLKVL